MPVYRVPRAHLDAELVRLERSGEHVEHIVADYSDFVIVTRRSRVHPSYFPVPTETRGDL